MKNLSLIKKCLIGIVLIALIGMIVSTLYTSGIIDIYSGDFEVFCSISAVIIMILVAVIIIKLIVGNRPNSNKNE